MKTRISKDDLLRAAIILDCEGSIVIKGRTPSDRRHHQLYVCVATADLVLTPFLHNLFGGTLNIRIRNGKPISAATDGISDVLDWRIFGHNAVAMLKRIQPFIMLKKEQVRLAIEFGKTLLPKGGNKVHPVPEDSIALRENIREKMQHLNQRGTLRLTA